MEFCKSVEVEVASGRASPLEDLFSLNVSRPLSSLANNICSMRAIGGHIQNTSQDRIVSANDYPLLNGVMLDAQGFIGSDEPLRNETEQLVARNEKITERLATLGNFSSYTKQNHNPTSACHEIGIAQHPRMIEPQHTSQMHEGELDLRISVSASPAVGKCPFRAVTLNEQQKIDQFLGIGCNWACLDMPTLQNFKATADDTPVRFTDRSAIPSEQVVDPVVELQHEVTRRAPVPDIRVSHNNQLVSQDDDERDMPRDSSTMIRSNLLHCLAEKSHVLGAFQPPSHYRRMQSQVLHAGHHVQTYQAPSTSLRLRKGNTNEIRDEIESASYPAENRPRLRLAERPNVDDQSVFVEPRRDLEEESLVYNVRKTSTISDVLAGQAHMDQECIIHRQGALSNLNNEEDPSRPLKFMDAMKVRLLYIKPIIKRMKNLETRFVRLQKSSTKNKTRYYAVKRMQKDVQELIVISQKIRIVATQLEIEKCLLNETVEQEKQEVERLRWALAGKGFPILM